ncbi:MAG: hypothetical protein IKB98_09190 [Clostridia bacterium]|nr:hypothetical protein [Clostridia bacterium]
MSKKLKYILCILLGLISALSFTACSFGADDNGIGDISGEITKLNAPANVRVENNIIKWSSVSDAGSYIVQIGDESHQATTTSLEYPISSLLSESASGLYVKVKALPSSSLLFSESDWSQVYGPVNYVVSTPSVNPDGFADAYASNGLGRTINMITATDFESWSGSVSIFDTSKLYKISLIEERIGKQEAVYYSGNDFSELAEKWSVKTSAKTNRTAGVKVPQYALGLSAGFSISGASGYEVAKKSETQQFFYKLRQNLVGKRVEVSGYKQTGTFSNILSETFLSDAQRVNNGTLTAKDFIEVYGTHVIMSAYYGGAIEANYYSVEHKNEESRDWYSNLETTLTSALTIGDVNAGFENGSSIDFTKFNSSTLGNKTTYFNAKAIGGSSRSFGNMETFAQNYSSWAESVNEDTYSLIDVPDGSLYCVWDYLPAEYANAKAILNEYLVNSCSDYYLEICDKIGKITAKDNVTFDIETSTLNVDLKEFYATGELTNISNGTFENGILTIYPAFNGQKVENVVIEGLYMTDDSLGVPITTTLNGLSIKFHEAWNRDVNVTIKNMGWIAVDGCSALDFSALNENCVANVCFEGENLIKGYNGANGASAGQNGFDGGSGIVANNLNLYGDGKITIFGGNGGNGATGYDGATGTESKDPTQGGKGGDGGKGGNCIKAKTTTLYLINYYFVGGNGGDGGTGGKGGNGFPITYRGADNNPDSFRVRFRGAKAGNGGNGGNAGEPGISSNENAVFGNGGNGGNGGRGGNSGYYYNGFGSVWLFAPGNGGNGGDGGNGVVAGTHGSGGLSGLKINRETDGILGTKFDDDGSKYGIYAKNGSDGKDGEVIA